MFDQSKYERTLPRPWQARCGLPGPYALRRPSPKMINRLEVLTCSRPARHDGDHEYADPKVGPIAKWSGRGEPLHPLPIKEL